MGGNLKRFLNKTGSGLEHNKKMLKKQILLVLALFLLMAFFASAMAVSVEFSVKAEGTVTKTVQNETIIENCTLNTETNLTDCINQTVTGESQVESPWEKTVVIDIECEDSCSYPMPSFNQPSDAQIEKYSLETSSNATVLFESTDSKSTKNPEDKINVKAQKAATFSSLMLEKMLPSTINEGVSQVNLFLTNNGTEAIVYINASIIGGGASAAYAESFDRLEPGRMAIIPVMLNASGDGQKDVVVRVNWKGAKNLYSSIYSYRINVLPKPGNEPKSVNSTEVIAQFNSDKETLRGYEGQYQQKQADGYLVSTVYDSIKDAKDYVATIQLLIGEEKFGEAKVKLALLELSLDDIDNGLQNALKTKQTFTDKLKNNALLISSIIAAAVAAFGFYEKQKMKIKALKEKIAAKKSAKESVKEAAKESSKKKPKEAPKKPGKKAKAPKKAEKESSKDDDDDTLQTPVQ